MTTLALRIAAPVALAVFAIVGALGSQRPAGVAIPIGLGIATIGGLLAWRDATGWPLAGGAILAAFGLAVIAHAQPANLGWFVICLLAGWVALDAAIGPALVVAVVLIGIPVAEWLMQLSEPGWWAWASGVAFTVMACGFARRQHLLVEELRTAQAGLAQRARAAERSRLAGEVHDVIGHALTVSLLHISSARLAIDDDPQLARASLDEAERLARASLDEVRASVGLIRDHADNGPHDRAELLADGEPGDRADRRPLPDASQVADLVDSFRNAGAAVDLEVSGDAAELGSARGLAIYRIVQESLTNAVRHAPGESVSVRITVDSSGATVAVTNRCPPGPAPEEGSGLMSMRERVGVLGGRLLAGPAHPGPGWRVEGWLPT